MHFILNESVYQVYIDLKKELKGKDFDIVTTNQDLQFARDGPKKDVAIIQIYWRYLQYSKRCHDKVYEFTQLVNNLFPQIKDGELPKHLIPLCPKCSVEIHEWVR